MHRSRGFARHWVVVARCAAALFAILGAWTGRVPTVRAADEPRPNVLLIMSDDLNNALGCYGQQRMQTPYLDQLAQRGVRFERAYCQFPLCGPSRNSLLCGLYPNSTGILTNGQIFRQTIPQHHSLPHAFRLGGYFAGRIGKMYHYNVPASIGTNGHDDPGSWELELNPAGCDRLLEEPDIFSLTPGSFGASLSWYASPREDRLHTDGMLATDAEWVLERCARDRSRPFFLAVGFYRPHTPYVSPAPYFDLYPSGEMPLVTGIADDRMDLPLPALASGKKEQDETTDELRQKAIQAYFASISFMDAQVGRVVAALDRLGLSDNTIIVFISDHGYHLGEHGLWQKMSLFEESARVPLIVVAPRKCQPGTTVDAPVGLVDVYPTLTELCGVASPPSLQGQSLVPMLQDPTAAGRGWALSQVTRGGKDDPFFGYSIRTPQWRYTEWDVGKRGRELYDHAHDARELTNLADDPAHANTVAELSRLLHDAVATSLPESGQVPALRPNTWAPDITN